jgi:hypothetical protein
MLKLLKTRRGILGEEQENYTRKANYSKKSRAYLKQWTNIIKRRKPFLLLFKT